MLQFEWPETWEAEVMDAVRHALQKTIRNAMASTSSQNSQIRGSVVVEDINFGSTPPVVALSSIRELSATHTAVVVSVTYAGDASIALKGLQINLDTTTPSTGERGELIAERNLAVPFFCPFEMKLKDIVIDGNILVEFRLETAAGSVGTSTARSGGTSTSPAGQCEPRRVQSGLTLPPHILSAAMKPKGAAAASVGRVSAVGGTPTVMMRTPLTSNAMASVGRANRAAVEAATPAGRAGGSSPSFSSSASAMGGLSMLRAMRSGVGLGLLVGGGGRRAMRQPDAAGLTETLARDATGSSCRGLVDNGGPDTSSRETSVSATPVPHGLAGEATESPPRTARVSPVEDGAPNGLHHQVTLSDIHSKAVSVTKRRLRLQLFGDPIKAFRVESNFGSVQGADRKIEAQLRHLLSPAIERMKTHGLDIAF